MKNKKGRPVCNDDAILLAVARKIKANSEMTVRSAIVQCLPVFSDAGVRRIQRKWKSQKAYYLNKANENQQREIDRTYIGVAPRSYFSIAQEMQETIERITAPTRRLRETLDEMTAPARHMQEMLDQMNAPFRRIQEMQDAIRLQMPAIHSAKRLAEALKPSGLELAMEQVKRFELENMMPSSALQVMRIAK